MIYITRHICHGSGTKELFSLCKIWGQSCFLLRFDKSACRIYWKNLNYSGPQRLTSFEDLPDFGLVRGFWTRHQENRGIIFPRSRRFSSLWVGVHISGQKDSHNGCFFGSSHKWRPFKGIPRPLKNESDLSFLYFFWGAFLGGKASGREPTSGGCPTPIEC